MQNHTPNHQNPNPELEKIHQAEREFWLSALMRSPDVEGTYQKLRQSVIETHQSLQKCLDDSQKEAMSQSLSLTANMSELEKEELLKETREMFLEINKSMGMDEQSLKIRLEQRLTDLENIKNQAIATKKQRKTSFMIAIVVVLLITIGLYVLR